MELREPPRPRRAAGATGRNLLLFNTVLLALLLAALVWLRFDLAGPGGDGAAAQLDRATAAKLKAAGLDDQAAHLYERALSAGEGSAGERAEIAHGVGATYLDQGRCEEALRWLYQAETLLEGADGEVRDRIGGPVAEKIVACLERLGRSLAAKSALAASTRLAPPTAATDTASNPVVARIGERELRRSDVDAALELLPPAARAQLTATAEGRAELLRKVVADDLLLAKAERLGLDDDPQIRRQAEEMRKQAVLAAFIDREVVSKITVDAADLENFWTAHQDQWTNPETEETPELEEVRSAVEAAYRRQKAESAYREMVTEALAGAEVELHPERLAAEGEPNAP
ncbi:MAG: hypothetical protein AAF481_09310 [Acidobacteriota bacterium]